MRRGALGFVAALLALAPACNLLFDADALSAGDAGVAPDADASNDGGGTTPDGGTIPTDGQPPTDSPAPSDVAPGPDTSKPTYADVVLSDGPIAYWRLGEKGGTTANDRKGTYPATLMSSAPKWGAAGALVNDTDTALTQDDPALGGFKIDNSAFDFANVSPFTLEIWTKLTSVDGEYRMFFCKDYTDGTTGRQEYGFYVQATAGIVFERYVDGASVGVYNIPTPSLNVWHHVVATYDGTQLGTYVDGALAGVYADTRAAKAKPSPLMVGAFYINGVSPILGVIDEAAIYTKALSAARVKAHYDSGMGR